MSTFVSVVSVLVVAVFCASEVKWLRAVKAAYETQRQAYEAYTRAFASGDVATIEAAENRILGAAAELRGLRRWYPWRRL